jgi:hypothetical protein
LINYALIYLLIVVGHTLPLLGIRYISNVYELVTWDYSSPLGIILLIALAIFILGFIHSWKKEKVAGILFIIWYAIILVMTILFREFSHSGPWFMVGLTVLVQGILYITENRNTNKLKKQNSYFNRTKCK